MSVNTTTVNASDVRVLVGDVMTIIVFVDYRCHLYVMNMWCNFFVTRHGSSPFIVIDLATLLIYEHKHLCYALVS